MFEKSLSEYKSFLVQEEKSVATTEKYIRDIKNFFLFLKKDKLSKEAVLQYKKSLGEDYATSSANSMLVALNGFLRFINRSDCCVKPFKIQRQIFCNEEKELTRSEYQRLIAATKDTRLFYVMQTICTTGIRVSELKFITVEAVNKGRAEVNCKNKRRVIFIPSTLQKLLKRYIKKSGPKEGPVFVSKNGNPLNRSNIWRDMKALCEKAGVNSKKVFPHNLRHLFARTFYSVEKDIVRLADILGHSSINTTRIYTIETGDNHIMRLEKIQRLLVT